MLDKLIKKREEKKYKEQLYRDLENINQMIEETLKQLYHLNRLVIDYDDGSSLTIYIDHIKMIEKNNDNTSRVFLSVSDYIDTPYSYDVLPEAIALYKNQIDEVL